MLGFTQHQRSTSSAYKSFNQERPRLPPKSNRSSTAFVLQGPPTEMSDAEWPERADGTRPCVRGGYQSIRSVSSTIKSFNVSGADCATPKLSFSLATSLLTDRWPPKTMTLLALRQNVAVCQHRGGCSQLIGVDHAALSEFASYGAFPSLLLLSPARTFTAMLAAATRS